MSGVASLSEYITAIAWSPSGNFLALSSAGGEVAVWGNNTLIPLLEKGEQSIDCLAFSADGQWLASGGQDGCVRLWHYSDEEYRLVNELDTSPAWVDQLAWCPTRPELAFGSGKTLKIWNAQTKTVVALCPLESSVLSLSWQPQGEHIAVAGNKGIQVWSTANEYIEPTVLALPVASTLVSWSSDSQFIATGNFDKTLTVWRWGESQPWIMQGFPGKIRHLAWSLPLKNAPILAATTLKDIVLWKKQPDYAAGWNPRVLEYHTAAVGAIAFHPQGFLLASASQDGKVALWQNLKEVVKVWETSSQGISCLAWHPQGKHLAAGSSAGELFIESL